MRKTAVLLLVLASILFGGCAIAAYEGYEEYEKEQQKEPAHEKSHKPAARHS